MEWEKFVHRHLFPCCIPFERARLSFSATSRSRAQRKQIGGWIPWLRLQGSHNWWRCLPIPKISSRGQLGVYVNAKQAPVRRRPTTSLPLAADGPRRASMAPNEKLFIFFCYLLWLVCDSSNPAIKNLLFKFMSPKPIITASLAIAINIHPFPFLFNFFTTCDHLGERQIALKAQRFVHTRERSP